jgi:hypothetical protein
MDDRTGSPRDRRWARRGLIAGMIVLLTVGGAGVAWTLIPDRGTGVIHGCYASSNGALRVIDPSKGQSCSAGEAPLDWNQRGINWRGNWKATKAYAVNDAVALDGSSYIATVANTGSRPPSADWSVLAGKASTYANAFSESNESNPSEFPVLVSSNLTVVGSTGALPAGNYTVSAQVAVFMDNGAQDVICYLVDSSGNFANGYAETSGPPDPSSTGVVQTIGLTDSFASERNHGRILLKCAKADGADPNTTEVVSASITATQVDTLATNETVSSRTG